VYNFGVSRNNLIISFYVTCASQACTFWYTFLGAATIKFGDKTSKIWRDFAQLLIKKKIRT